MNPLIRKELRLILPFWGIAIFLAVVPALIVPGDGWLSRMNEGIFWALGFGAILLGLAPFGQEFSLGTFQSMLAQPFERRRIWMTKILLILLAAVLVLLAFMAAVHFRLAADLRESLSQRPWLYRNTKLEDLKQTTLNFYHSEFWVAGLGGGAMLIFVGLAGGFWTSLLFRQTGAALWFAILIPGVILVGTEVVAHIFVLPMNILLVPTLLVYAVAGFIWAWRMFFVAQDAQWLGGTISLSGLSSAKPKTESTTARRQKPLAALLRKEFQSHQISLLIAFGLLVLHLATLIIRKFTPMAHTSELRFAVEAVPLLWLMLPWVIGAVAVAEERKLGTMESQLCLPVTRRLQFTVKLLIVLFLGVVIGGVIPCLIETLGVLANVPSGILQHGSVQGVDGATVFGMAFGALGIAFISFFASTLTRNTLMALGAAILIGGIFIALFQWLEVESRGYYYSLWRGPLLFIILVPVWIIALIWLCFSNYKRLHAGRNVWLQNFLVLAITLVCAGATAAVIYQRPWELAVSLEPKRGPARLNGPVHPVVYRPMQRVFALLPDGRIWAATDYDWTIRSRVLPGSNHTREEDLASIPIPHAGTFVGGSNWVALAADDRLTQVVALQSNGSLWSIISVPRVTIPHGTNFWIRWLEAVPAPHRIGSDKDWKSIAAGDRYFTAVKNDGTLWMWGSDMKQFAGASEASDETPWLIDASSHWTQVFPGGPSVLFVKQDGSVWQLVQADVQGKTKLEFTPMNANASDWLTVDHWYDKTFVIRKDRSLWARSFYQEGRFFGVRVPAFFNGNRFDPASGNFVHIGSDTDWGQISAGGEIFGLKKDGRLVKSSSLLFGARLGRRSEYSDWLAIDSNWGALTGLASDGTISLWGEIRYMDERPFVVLGPTRHPLWSLNIFSDTTDTKD